MSVCDFQCVKIVFCTIADNSQKKCIWLEPANTLEKKFTHRSTVFIQICKWAQLTADGTRTFSVFANTKFSNWITLYIS